MGYTTEFQDEFTLNKPLLPEHAAYLRLFSETRRMKRNEFLTVKRPDVVREAVGLPVGQDGAYFVGVTADYGQERSADVTEYNYPPAGQPGLWCQWIPTPNNHGIMWNEAEKFYCYVEWLEYLIGHFLAPWGYEVNGTVEYHGEEDDDFGIIVATKNEIVTKKGYTVDR